MLLRLLLMSLGLLTLLVLGGTILLYPPLGQSPAPPTPTPASTLTLGVPMLPGPTPAPGTPNPNYTPQPVRVTERARRSAAMTDGDILADVQQRVLAKLPQAADAQARRATLQAWQPVVRRYGPGQLASVSKDAATLALDPTRPLAVVVVPWGDSPKEVVRQGPAHAVDYLLLIYDPDYAAPSHIVWAPESDLVQAITGNRSKPTATVAPTVHPTVVAAQATAQARPTGTAGDTRPGLQPAP